MLIFKKLIFALPFLLFFALFCLNLSQSLQNTNAIFPLNLEELLKTVLLVLYLSLALMFFMIFATLSQDWKFILPVIVLGSAVPFLFISSPNYILILGFLISFLIINFFFQKKLNNYLTFKASSLLIPSIKTLSTLIILVSSIVFYFFISDDLENNGFKIPDSIIDPVINLTTQNLNIPQGLSPNDLIKTTINSQIQSLINPNLGIISGVLAITFFVSLNFISSILVLILYPLIAIIFWFLEKTGFTTYQTEMREVKKLVI